MLSALTTQLLFISVDPTIDDAIKDFQKFEMRRLVQPGTAPDQAVCDWPGVSCMSGLVDGIHWEEANNHRSVHFLRFRLLNL